MSFTAVSSHRSLHRLRYKSAVCSPVHSGVQRHTPGDAKCVTDILGEAQKNMEVTEGAGWDKIYLFCFSRDVYV